MYDDINMLIKTNNCLSEKITSSLGVKQGDVLSPILFNIFFSDIAEIFDKSCDPVVLNSNDYNCLLFADDMIIMSKSKVGLQNCLDKVSEYCESWKLNINVAKTKVMIMNRGGRMFKDEFVLNNVVLQNVQSYTYLGVLITNCFSVNSAMEYAKNRGMKCLYKLKRLIYDMDVSAKLCLKLFDQLVKPVFMYGSEIWGIPKINSKMAKNNDDYCLE